MVHALSAAVLLLLGLEAPDQLQRRQTGSRAELIALLDQLADGQATCLARGRLADPVYAQAAV